MASYSLTDSILFNNSREKYLFEPMCGKLALNFGIYLSEISKNESLEKEFNYLSQELHLYIEKFNKLIEEFENNSNKNTKFNLINYSIELLDYILEIQSIFKTILYNSKPDFLIHSVQIINILNAVSENVYLLYIFESKKLGNENNLLFSNKCELKIKNIRKNTNFIIETTIKEIL